MFEKDIEKIIKKNNYVFFHTKSTVSTMFDAKNYLKNYKKNCIYLSDKQLDGKGQRANKWHSPPGNIYCSFSFDNFLDIKEHYLFSVLVAVSIKMTLNKFNANDIYFKWPNDIFYKKKKFAGIISEIVQNNQKRSNIIIGFGINIISAPIIKNYETTFIDSFCDIKSINNFFLTLVKILFSNLAQLQQGKKNDLINFFSKYLMFIDKKIKITLPNNIEKKGIFRGINNDGSLKLEMEDGIESIYNGSIKI